MQALFCEVKTEENKCMKYFYVWCLLLAQVWRDVDWNGAGAARQHNWCKTVQSYSSGAKKQSKTPSKIT